MLKASKKIEVSEPIKPEYYSSIHKLPLVLFIEAIVDNKIEAIVISGQPPVAELYAAWADIIDQYNSALGHGSSDYQMYIMALKEFAFHDYRERSIIMLANIMKEVGYVEKFAGYLNQLCKGYGPLNFDIDNPELYKKAIERCYGVARGISIHKRIAYDEMERYQKQLSEGNGKEPLTWASFHKVLFNLSDHAGRPLKESEITVFEYCERVNRYAAYIEQLKKN